MASITLELEERDAQVFLSATQEEQNRVCALVRLYLRELAQERAGALAEALENTDVPNQTENLSAQLLEDLISDV